MTTTIVLAMHGTPPTDVAHSDISTLMHLHSALEHGSAVGEGRTELAEARKRYVELDSKIRAWPRTGDNDPFYQGSHDLAELLRQATGQQVFLGFNEFCAPSIEEALEQAALSGARTVIVVTPMTTRGGEHSERDIPSAVRAAAETHPEVKFIYAWPYDQSEVARFLATHISSFV